MKIAIIGSRTFNNYDQMKKVLGEHQVSLVVSGGARGADKLSEQYAKEKNIETLIFLAEWDKYGKSAGFIRNKKIVDNAEMVIAFWDGQSRGTKNSIDYANKTNKPVKIINF